MYYIRLVSKKNLYFTYIDEQYAGPLYAGDVRKLGLPLEGVVREEELASIQSLIYKRAFNKACSLLSVTELCAADIRFKLKLRDYPSSVIDAVIQELYDCHFLDDRRYAEQFIRCYAHKKSKALILRELSLKEISVTGLEELADEVYEEEGLQEDAVIQDLLQNRFSGYDLKDEKIQRKIYSFMQRRGFSPNQIKNCLT